MTPIYIGPSWAARSYDTYDDTDTVTTNIAKELELEVIDLATPGYTNYQLLKKLQSGNFVKILKKNVLMEKFH